MCACYVYVGDEFAGLGSVDFAATRIYAAEALHNPGKQVVMPYWYIHLYAKLPYCVVNRFGLLASCLQTKPQKLVVGHKTYECLACEGKPQRMRFRTEVTFCECELSDHQYEKRVVIHLIDNPDFQPAKPTGLEGISEL